MGVELPSSDWPAHAADAVSASPTQGGLLDGAAGPVPANSLALLMPAKDITGIKGLADYGNVDFTVPALTMDQVDPGRLVPVHTEGNYLGDQLAKGPHTPIGPVGGYPEDGKNIWRAELDDQITTAAANFNSKHGLRPGDSLYMTPQLAKSWIMQESGGSGDRNAFETDPAQVNVTGDWKNTGADKAKRLGLREGQTMTPATSIGAGLEWLYNKGAIHDSTGTVTGYRDLSGTFQRYNANPAIDGNGLPHYRNYANSILNR
jgi:hypothetical protein